MPTKEEKDISLAPVKVDEDLQIIDYKRLLNEAIDIENTYKGYIGNEKDVRKMKRRVNRLKRGLNDVRKAKARPYQKALKGFKAKIDNLRSHVDVVVQAMNKQLKIYRKRDDDKIKRQCQPDMDNFCKHHGLEPMPVPDAVVTRKSYSKRQRLDIMLGTVKTVARQKQLANACEVNGKVINAETGELISDLQAKQLTFIGKPKQLDELLKLAQKHGIKLIQNQGKKK